MLKIITRFTFSLLFLGLLSNSGCDEKKEIRSLKTGADQLEMYLPLIKDKNVGVVANQTSLVGRSHLVDTLLQMGVKVKKIFGPEHGFRGYGEAGESIDNSIDKKSGLPVISLHGKYKRPQKADLAGLEVILFDIQDVGVRFYTYLSTLQYMMEACAENQIELVILDRPNPNGFYVDGPILDSAYRSFLGLNPIPVVHGMTLGEMAKMILGEKWMNSKEECKLTVITCQQYQHQIKYILPVKPSPNLPTMASVYLYPSLGFFEGTFISAGRGTQHPFELYGHPEFSKGNYSFVPQSIEGASKNPKFRDETCNGYFLGNEEAKKILEKPGINLRFLITAYHELESKNLSFFNEYFPHHAGNDLLQEQIRQGLSIDQIKKSWEPGLSEFKAKRKKYLLYPDFE